MSHCNQRAESVFARYLAGSIIHQSPERAEAGARESGFHIRRFMRSMLIELIMGITLPIFSSANSAQSAESVGAAPLRGPANLEIRGLLIGNGTVCKFTAG
jgi:hypothetical protein